MSGIYDPAQVKARYGVRAEAEWARLEATPRGKLMYEAHRQVILRHIQPGDAVLEVGSGSGRFTKDLAELAGYLVVTDLTPEQLAFNRAKMTELGLVERIAEWRETDICDLSVFADECFDAVVCIGGAFNYLFDKEEDAFREMLRVLRPGGVLLLGLMCLPGAVHTYFEGAMDEFDTLGLEAARWILETGLQDGVRYPITYNHLVHLMTRNDVLALCQAHGAEVVAEYSGGFLATVDQALLERAYANPVLWQLLVEAELRWCTSPGLTEAGDHLVMVARK